MSKESQTTWKGLGDKERNAMFLAGEARRLIKALRAHPTRPFSEFTMLVAAAQQTFNIQIDALSRRSGIDKAHLSALLVADKTQQITSMIAVLEAIVDIAQGASGIEGALVLDWPGFDPDLTAPSIQTPRPAASPRGKPSTGANDAGVLAGVLAKLARDEIAAIRAERPNDPETAARNDRFVELLEVFADGFGKIHALLSNTPGVVETRQAATISQQLGERMTRWIKVHGPEVFNKSARTALMVAGLFGASAAGANMTIATGLLGAAFLGKDALSVAKDAGAKSKPKRSKTAKQELGGPTPSNKAPSQAG